MTDSGVGSRGGASDDTIGPLLFVNLDTENRKLTRATERKNKNSHVQATAHKKKKAAARDRLQATSALPWGWRSRAENGSSSSTQSSDPPIKDWISQETHESSPDDTLPDADNDSIVEHCRRREPLHTLKDEEVPWAQQPQSSSTLFHGRYPSFRNYFDSTTDQLDPFNTSIIPISKSQTRALRQYINRVLPHYWPIPLRSESLKNPILKLIMSEPHVFYAGLCIASAVKADIPDQKVKAIRAINTALQNPTLRKIDGLLYAIGHMLGVESLMAGSKNDVVTHIQGLITLLNLRGGLQGLPTFIIEHVFNAVYRHATIYATIPSLPPPTPPERKLSIKTAVLIRGCSSAEQQSLCSALLSPLIAEYFSSEMLDIIHGLRDIIQYRENFICNTVGVKLNEVEYISFMELHVQYSLLALPSKVPHHEIQEPCRIALLMALNNASTDLWSPASKLFRAIISQLRNALDWTDLQSFWKPAHEALLWVLWLGAHNSEGQPDRSWFITYISHGAELLGLRTLEALRSVLIRFTFIPRIYENSLRRIWEEIEQSDGSDVAMEMAG